MKSEAEERATFVNDSLDGSILSADAASAGVGYDDQTSRTSIVKQLERLQYQCVRQSHQNHPNKDAHPVKSFDQRDKVSQAWLSAIPTPTSFIPSPEYTSLATLCGNTHQRQTLRSPRRGPNVCTSSLRFLAHPEHSHPKNHSFHHQRLWSHRRC